MLIQVLDNTIPQVFTIDTEKGEQVFTDNIGQSFRAVGTVCADWKVGELRHAESWFTPNPASSTSFDFHRSLVRVVLCQCGSGKVATTRGFNAAGELTLTRCSQCEPSVDDKLSINAIAAE